MRIEMASHGKGRVWLDGVEIEGLTRVECDFACGTTNRVKLWVTPVNVRVAGPVQITCVDEFKPQFPPNRTEYRMFSWLKWPWHRN